ncbi:MAG: hypothetical protein A3F14_06210 [Gammaproteobacteria bacterium RIFCSPHIGHO2_12_FULL_43_28]|nr:MAG: hypothetical protein A3F14_06210 [Gammaproteobacteria bacterium RIFCSPHIGHO2_12_FULL_43_28]
MQQTNHADHDCTSQLPDDCIVRLHDDGILQVKGQDAKRFLQGQLTCDIEKVVSDKLTLGAHCNPQGRIISLFYLFMHDEAYFLIMPHSLIATATTALKKYIAFYRAEMSDVSDVFNLMGTMKRIDKANALNHNFILLSFPSIHSRFMLIGKKEMLNERWIKESNLTTVDADTWKTINVKEGIPAIYPATSTQFLPHEINLPQLNAIDFDKGCYTGQEIIARMHYRGKLKKKMYCASIETESPLIAGQPIYAHINHETQVAGTIVDWSQLPNNHKQKIALIVINEVDAKNQHLSPNENHDAFFTLT